MRKTPVSSQSLKRSGSNNNGGVSRKRKKRKQFVPHSFLDCQSLTHVIGFPPQHELVTTPVASDFVKELFLDRFVKEIVEPFQPDRSKKIGGDGKRSTVQTIDSNAGYYHVMVGGKLIKKRRISQDTIQPKTNESSSSDQGKFNDVADDKLARKRKMWTENIVIGTNQCLRLLESLNVDHSSENNTESKAPNESASTTTKRESDATLPPRNPSLIVLAKNIYPPTMCCAIPVLAKRLGIPLLLLSGKASLELGKALNAKRSSILILCCGNDSIDRSDNVHSSGENEFQHRDVSEFRRAITSFISFMKDQMRAVAEESLKPP